jgi:hypothetical protein
MTPEIIVFWVIIDPLTFVLGSLGGYLLFHEVVDLEHMPSLMEIFQIAKKRWWACAASISR